jgi:hypothetical protein
MRVNSDSVSNEIDENDRQHGKQDEQRIWTWRGIVIDVICRGPNSKWPIWVTSSVAIREGKKTEEGTMMSPSEHESESESNLTVIIDPPETQSLTPATTKEASDILINCRNWFWESHEIENYERLDHVPPQPPPPGRATLCFVSYQWGYFCRSQQLIVMFGWRIEEGCSSRFEVRTFWWHRC